MFKRSGPEPCISSPLQNTNSLGLVLPLEESKKQNTSAALLREPSIIVTYFAREQSPHFSNVPWSAPAPGGHPSPLHLTCTGACKEIPPPPSPPPRWRDPSVDGGDERQGDLCETLSSVVITRRHVGRARTSEQEVEERAKMAVTQSRGQESPVMEGRVGRIGSER